jgi:hypothetical protein
MLKKSENFLVIAVLLVYILHQDIWFWNTAKPFFFGFMPIGLFYHVCFSLVASVIMCLLVKHCWPEYLEKEVDDIEHNHLPDSKPQD